MGFNLQAVTTITSATLELNMRELQALAAAEHLELVCEDYTGLVVGQVMNPDDRPDSVKALDFVLELLRSCKSLAGQVGEIQPKRTIARRKKAEA